MSEEKEFLQKLHDQSEAQTVLIHGKCHDCGADVTIKSTIIDAEGQTEISGGALYVASGMGYCKCDECFRAESNLTNYQPIETYSRIVGYLRPIQQWNPGKQAEFAERVDFKA